MRERERDANSEKSNSPAPAPKDGAPDPQEEAPDSDHSQESAPDLQIMPDFEFSPKEVKVKPNEFKSEGSCPKKLKFG